MSSDGGPAFLVSTDSPYNRGMSLRDCFAAHALQGFLAQSLGTAMGSRPEIAAEYAYVIADAMLAERSKR